MRKLTRDDLFGLERYAEQRNAFRTRVLEHKKDRKLMLGDYVSMHFEDHLTIQYQVQEMLRVERIFESEGIAEELAAYNPLIPDGANLKATFMIEYADVDERKRALAMLVGIEDKVWLRVPGFEPVWAIADEDLERERPDKTSAVHFMRFEFTPAMIAALKEGAVLAAGIGHENYTIRIESVPEATRNALVADFD